MKLLPNLVCTYNDLLSQFARYYEEDCQNTVVNSIKANFKRVTGFGINERINDENFQAVLDALKSHKMPLVTFGEWLEKELALYEYFDYGTTGVSVEPEAEILVVGELSKESKNTLSHPDSLVIVHIVDDINDEVEVSFQGQDGLVEMTIKHDGGSLDKLQRVSGERALQHLECYLSRGYKMGSLPDEEEPEMTVAELFQEAYKDRYGWAYLPRLRDFCNITGLKDDASISALDIWTEELPYAALKKYLELVAT